MASKLNEYCLNHLFSFLQPHDLLQVSEVCQLWARTALRQWQKIKEIDTLQSFELKRKTLDETQIILTATDAKKIISYVAPFLKVLKIYKNYEYFFFGIHCYKVEDLQIDAIMKILVARSNGITEVCFIAPLKAELMISLMKNNKVKTLRYYDFEGYHQYIPTDGIENLELRFTSVDDNFKSLEGYFPNLKKLKLDIEMEYDDVVERTIAQILPYVHGLKSLDLIISPKCSYEDNYNMLWDIYDLSQLEELSIHVTFNVNEADAGDNFLADIPSSCPKLRILKIYLLVDINEETLLSLMSMPDLETFDVVLSTSFLPMKFPEMKNLTAFIVTFFCLNPDVTGFSHAVQMMPNLKNMKVDFVDDFSKEKQIKLVHDVALVAASQGKEITVTQYYHLRKQKQLKITKKKNPQAAAGSVKECQTLHFAAEFESKESPFESVQKLLQNDLQSYDTVILDCPQKSSYRI